MRKVERAPVVHPPEAVLTVAAACVVGVRDGHLPEGCAGVDAQFVDTDGDGKLEIVVEVEVSAVRG